EQAGGAESRALLVGELPLPVALGRAGPELVAEAFRHPEGIFRGQARDRRGGAFGSSHGSVLSVVTVVRVVKRGCAGTARPASSAGAWASAQAPAKEPKSSTSDSSTNSPRAGTFAPSSSSSGAKCRSTASRWSGAPP